MRIDVLTLFTEMFQGVLGSSILKRAAQQRPDPKTGQWLEPAVSYHLHDIRPFTCDKHGKVDQPSYGGGPGMVMQCQPVFDALEHVRGLDQREATVIHFSPAGDRLTQQRVEQLAELSRLVLICGHYEGVDQRLLDEVEPVQISVGDFVLSGGELPAMVLIDAVVRLLPGVLGDADSASHDSFSPGAARLLDHPHYTRPPQWRGRSVPEILLSGHHAQIQAWRRQQAIETTRRHRPDLLPENDDAAGEA